MRILDVSHISSRGESFRITLPKKIIKRLDLKEDDIITFFEDSDKIYIDKLQVHK